MFGSLWTWQPTNPSDAWGGVRHEQDRNPHPGYHNHQQLRDLRGGSQDVLDGRREGLVLLLSDHPHELI
jgi:hypothetical protein